MRLVVGDIVDARIFVNATSIAIDFLAQFDAVFVGVELSLKRSKSVRKNNKQRFFSMVSVKNGTYLSHSPSVRLVPYVIQRPTLTFNDKDPRCLYELQELYDSLSVRLQDTLHNDGIQYTVMIKDTLDFFIVTAINSKVF